jgi:hypothetical protein
MLCLLRRMMNLLLHSRDKEAVTMSGILFDFKWFCYKSELTPQVGTPASAES